MLNDLNPPNRHVRRSRRRLPLLLLIICLAGAALASFSPGEKLRTTQLAQSESPAKPSAAGEESLKTIYGSIRPGDTMTSLMGKLFTPQELQDLARQCRQVYPLTGIAAGQSYQLSMKDGCFERFAYDIDCNEQLIICRDGTGYSVSRKPIPYEIEQVAVKGAIDSSLFQAVVEMGESEGLAIQLADIFAWDIDFFHDIHPGDTFELVVEKRFRNGKPAGNGRLLAARFTVQDETYQAFHFQDGSRSPDYYDQNGRSLRKAFLKAPLSFSRISSGFNMRRRHPVTNRIKAHPAIDYAAPTGTPIHTVGDGTVTFASYKRYNGKCVKVRHPNGWQTMYNHMSRIGKDIRAGKKVRQGQVIGYVGSTGLSTGPHLDFRLYKNGEPVNPLKIKSPPARPVSRANMAAFRLMVADRVAYLNSQPPQQTARATETAPAPAKQEIRDHRS